MKAETYCTCIVLLRDEMKLVLITDFFAIMLVQADAVFETSLLSFSLARAMPVRTGTGERAKEAVVVKPLTAPIF
jgi:hypothetical protein